jgi:hypothetical protein
MRDTTVIQPTAVTEWQSMSVAVGVAFVVLGLYFLYHSRR